MACPYFRPSARMPMERWTSPPRLPLVDPFDGVCEAGAEAWAPDDFSLKERCNFGYARGRCPRFPSGAAVDAVRFTMRGAGQLLYVFEKDYSPVEHGAAETAAGRLAAQAGAFADSWRRRAGKEPEP